ncbi:MAG TPA: SAM-dependent methyltransferase [Pseudonocardiaceae bacterium]|nr:SAM-dependent methyltransferase [Pseudonocardiaceae bacterium]
MDPVALTALMVAAARAREHERLDRLFSDPYAAALVGEQGAGLLADVERAGGDAHNNPYLSIRVRFFDDLLLEAVSSTGVRQVVLLAAGMDTRAFRLPWPVGTKVYELDRPSVLAGKDAILENVGAVPRCTRHRLDVDLALPWAQALAAVGFDRHTPSIWLAEGFLQYLDDAAARRVLSQATQLAAPGSVLGANLVSATFLMHPATRSFRDAFAQLGAPLQWGTDEPAALLAQYGWRAIVTVPGEEGANFGRWPWPITRDPDTPRSFWVTAHR